MASRRRRPGLIELKGEDVTWLPPYKRHVNTVFQNYALFPHLTVYENVAFGLRRSEGCHATRRSGPGLGDAQARRAAGLRATQADPAVGRPGAARRARPGAHQPAGGPAARRAARCPRSEAAASRCRSSSRIQQEVGITFIFVTHDQEEAMTMSDRIAVMNHGLATNSWPIRRAWSERPSHRGRGRRPRVSATCSPRRPFTGTADGYAVSRLGFDGSEGPVPPRALTRGADRYEVGAFGQKIRLRELRRGGPGRARTRCRTDPGRSRTSASPRATSSTPGAAAASPSTNRTSNGHPAELWEPGVAVRMTLVPPTAFAVEAGGDPPGGPACRSPQVPLAPRARPGRGHLATHGALVGARRPLAGRFRGVPRLDLGWPELSASRSSRGGFAPPAQSAPPSGSASRHRTPAKSTVLVGPPETGDPSCASWSAGCIDIAMRRTTRTRPSRSSPPRPGSRSTTSKRSTATRSSSRAT